MVAMDLESYDKIMLAVYRAATVPSGWADLIGLLGQMYPEVCSHIFGHDTRASQFVALACQNYDPDYVTSYVTHFGSINPSVAALARAPEAKITSTGHRGNAPAYAPGRVADGDFETYFATDDGVTNTVVEVELGGVREIEGVILQEYIPLGQRVESYTVECRVDGQWKPVATGRRIGFKRILLEGRGSSAGVQFPAADAVRLKIDRAASCPLISGFQVIGGEP